MDVEIVGTLFYSRTSETLSHHRSAARMQPFSNLSELLIIPFSHKNFIALSRGTEDAT